MKKIIFTVLLSFGFSLGSLEAKEKKETLNYATMTKSRVDFKAWDFGLRHKETIDFCDKVLEHQPHSAEAHFRKGVALGEMDRYQEAIDSLTLAIKYKYFLRGWDYFQRGYYFELMGKLEEALADYEKAIEFDIDSREVYYHEVGVLIKLGWPLDYKEKGIKK